MMRRRNALFVGLLLSVTAACGGGAGAGDRARTGASTSTTQAISGVYPLTGMPAVNPANAGRPAVAVKIDNSSAARPQAGIEKADVIYEEFTEGITRFVVVYHSSDAPMVGPVRSVRPADPSIIKPLGGPLVFSGGSPAVLDVVRSAGIGQVTENDTDTLKRRSGHSAPHNLYTSTDAMFKKIGAGPPPPDFARFLAPGAAVAAPGATPVPSFRLAAAPGVTASYEWDVAAGVWKRSTDGRPHGLEGNTQIAPTNVIVQYTPYSLFLLDKKIRYPEVVGSGEALIFVKGMQIKARWTKTAPSAVTTYVDSAGAPIALAPGQTWVHLQEPGSGVTVG